MQEYMLPDEYLSCPGCGRHYGETKTVCIDCDECNYCHGTDHDPNWILSDQMIAEIESGKR